MIYTITLNPCIDHYLFLDGEPALHGTNRAMRSRTLCGGKGINVGAVCTMLGLDAVCTGFCGGFTGAELLRRLGTAGIKHEFIMTGKETRINAKIVSGGRVTEINSPGEPPDDDDIGALVSVIEKAGPDDTVVLSGSVPDKAGLLETVLEAIKRTGAYYIADTSGRALKECLSYSPDLIKPNREEASQLLGITLESWDIKDHAGELIALGARAALVSDGEKGAYFTDGNSVRHVPVTDAGYKAVNTTGAGDSMIAGYLYGSHNGIDPLICAVAAGSASAYCENIFDKNVFFRVIKSYGSL